jgi:hypothetical protein
MEGKEFGMGEIGSCMGVQNMIRLFVGMEKPKGPVK